MMCFFTLELKRFFSLLGEIFTLPNLNIKYIIQDSPDCVLQRSLTQNHLVPTQKLHLFKPCSSSCQAHNSHFDIFIIEIQPLGLVQTSIMLCSFARSIWSSMPLESCFTERCWFSRSYFKCNKANKWRNDLSLNSARRNYFCRSFSPTCFFLSAFGLLNNISVVTCKTFKLNPTLISRLVLVYCCAIECLHAFKRGRPGRNHYYPVLLMWLNVVCCCILFCFYSALRIKSPPKHRIWQDQTWVWFK